MASYTSKVIAVLGRTVRAGRWKVSDDSLVIALFGRCALDLSRAYVDEEDEDLSMSVFALFGSVSILLPPGCDVEPSGVAIAASSEVEIPSERNPDITRTALAPLDISWLALFAKVRIAEVHPESPSLRAAAGSPDPVGESADHTLPPPAVEVFSSDDGGDGAGADRPLPDAPSPLEEVEPARDPADEAAALRDEIAQWRAESGRSTSSDDDPSAIPDNEIVDESELSEDDADSGDDAESVVAPTG